MAAKARTTQNRDQVPIILPKAARPLAPAHVALLHLVAEAIVDSYFAERDATHGEEAS